MDGVIAAGPSSWEAWSVRAESLSVLNMLRDLEQQVEVYRRHAAHVASSLGGGHFAAAREAADALRQALDAIMATTSALQGYIVPLDGLGATVESLTELAIRARRMVVVAQTDVLREVLRGPVAAERSQGWFIGRFRHVDHVADFFTNEFYRINCLWIQYRRDDQRAAAMESEDRVTLYQTALRVAQQAMRGLGNDPALAQFLRKGTAADSWPEVQAACMQIAAALTIQIDMEPSRQLSVQLRAAHRGDAAPARKS
jgi:hypothetical protein